MLKFENKDQETLEITHGFVKSLYEWNYDGQAKEKESNEVESDNENNTAFSVTIEGNKIDVSGNKIHVCESNMDASDENKDNENNENSIWSRTAVPIFKKRLCKCSEKRAGNKILSSILCHVGTNDLSEKSLSAILNNFQDLIQKSKSKFPTVRVFISAIVS